MNHPEFRLFIFAAAWSEDHFWLKRFGIALLAVALFLTLTTRGRSRGERSRRFAFGLICLGAGPAIGLAAAGLRHIVQGLEPVDLAYNYGSLVTIGAIGGAMVGVPFLVAGLGTPRAGSGTPEGAQRNELS
jgi:hypothetical protein